MVHHVERLPAELQPCVFADLEILDRGDIPLVEAGSDQHIAAAVAEDPLHHALRLQPQRLDGSRRPSNASSPRSAPESTAAGLPRPKAENRPGPSSLSCGPECAG